MLGLPVLIDTLISMVVLYILFSIVNSSLIESFARWFKTRAVFLKNTLFNLFDKIDGPQSGISGAMDFLPKLLSEPVAHKETSFAQKIYDHPLIKKLEVFDKGKMSSIDKGLFAEIVISLLSENKEITSKEQVLAMVEARKDLTNEMKGIFGQFIRQLDDTKGEIIKQLKNYISSWYEFYMKKASESYKNHIRKYLFIGGLILALVLNIDTISLTEYFYKNPQARESFVSLGKTIAKDSIQVDSQLLSEYIYANRENLNGNKILDYMLSITKDSAGDTIKFSVLSPLPFGFGKTFQKPDLPPSETQGFYLCKFIGILLTALALSFGSPFWFEALKKMISVKDQFNTK